MKNALSGNRGSLHGLAEILAQAPMVAAAFGKWPGFVLMLIAVLALFTVSLVTAIAIGRTALICRADLDSQSKRCGMFAMMLAASAYRALTPRVAAYRE